MAESNDILLRMSDINKRFPGVRALESVSIEVKRGTVHGLVGQNGAGKSTLMNVLFGLLQPDSGTITFDGADYRGMSPALAKQLGIAMVPQIIQNQPFITVAENLFVGDWPVNGRGVIDWARMEREAGETFAEMGLDVDIKATAQDLSVGQQQMVEIARALRLRAKLMVLDEPTPPLNMGEVQTLFKLIQSLRAKGVTFIYISHYLQEIFDICDDVTVMRDGKVVNSCEVDSIDMPICIRQMVGRDVNLYPERTKCISEDDAIEVRGLNTTYLRDISFHVRKGEIVGLAGLTGAGRTEVGKAIYGLDPILSGDILVEGRPITVGGPEDALMYGIAYLPEDRRGEGAVVIRSVKENITLSSLKDYVGSLGFIRSKEEQQAAQGWVDSLGIRTPSLNQIVSLLSGGNQQKVVLAKLLGTKAKVLIMDEPTMGIDVGAKAEIHRLMNDLAAQGHGIILISSDLPELLAMSDRVLVLREGSIFGEMASADATEEKVLLYSEGQKQEPVQPSVEEGA